MSDKGASGIARAALHTKTAALPDFGEDVWRWRLLTSHFAGLVLLVWALSGWLGYCTFYANSRKSHFSLHSERLKFQKPNERSERIDDVDVSFSVAVGETSK